MNLLGLPNELLDHIANADLSPKDLKSLRLSHSHLASIAHPGLFRQLTVYIDAEEAAPPFYGKKPLPVTWRCVIGARKFPIAWTSDTNGKRVVTFQTHASNTDYGSVPVGANPFGNQDETQPPWEAIRDLTIFASVPDTVPKGSWLEKLTDGQLAIINFASERMPSLEVLRWNARCIHLSSSYTIPDRIFNSPRITTLLTLPAWKDLPNGHICARDCIGRHSELPEFYTRNFRNVRNLTIDNAYYTSPTTTMARMIADWIACSPNLTTLTFIGDIVYDRAEFMTSDHADVLAAILLRYPGTGPLPLESLIVPVLSSRTVDDDIPVGNLHRLSNLERLTITDQDHYRLQMYDSCLPDADCATQHGVLLKELTLPSMNNAWLGYLSSPQLCGVLRKLHFVLASEVNRHTPPNLLEAFWTKALPPLGESGALEELHLRSCIWDKVGYTVRGSPQRTALLSCTSLKVLTICPGSKRRSSATQLLELIWSPKENFLPELERLNFEFCKEPKVCLGCVEAGRSVISSVEKHKMKKCGNMKGLTVTATGFSGRNRERNADWMWKWREIRAKQWSFLRV